MEYKLLVQIIKYLILTFPGLGYKTYELEGAIFDKRHNLTYNTTIKIKMKPGEKRTGRPMIIEMSLSNNGGIHGSFRFPNALLSGIFK